MAEYDSTTQSLLDLATTALDRATQATGRIGTGARPSLKETAFTYEPGALNLQAPPQFSDLFGVNNDADPNIAAINSQVSDALKTFFPNISSSLAGIPEEWIAGVVGGTKPFGQDQTAFAVVFQRQRDRAAQATRSEQRTLEANFSSRGFSLPPGALATLLAQSEQRATEAALDTNREQAIQEANIKRELLQFAVQQATALKTGIMQAYADYFRSYYQVYELDATRERTRASAYQAFYGALSSYYNVEVNWEELKLRAAQLKAGTAANIDQNRLESARITAANSGLGAAVQGFSNIAAGAASSAGSLVAHIETGTGA